MVQAFLEYEHYNVHLQQNNLEINIFLYRFTGMMHSLGYFFYRHPFEFN